MAESETSFYNLHYKPSHALYPKIFYEKKPVRAVSTKPVIKANDESFLLPSGSHGIRKEKPITWTNIENLWKLYFPHDTIQEDDERILYIRKSSIFFQNNENSKKYKVIFKIYSRKRLK